MQTIRLEPVDAIAITILVDNVTDFLLVDEGPARRASLDVRTPRAPAPVLEGGTVPAALRAEHGFSALVTVERGGRERRILFEPIIGDTCDALAELSPDYLVPCHCTGWRAAHALAARFPGAFVQAAVGTRLELRADWKA